jgi:hypothetical protein
MSFWRKVRIAEIAVFFIGGLLLPFINPETPLKETGAFVSAIVILLPLLFSPPAIVMVISVQSINPFQNRQWTLPDWDSNFLNLRNPLHFFHAGAFFIAFSSIGTILASFFSDLSYLIAGLGGLSGSAGMLIGVKLCTKICSKKFQSVPETVQQKMDKRAFQWTKICGKLLILIAIIVWIIAGLLLKNSIQFKNRAVETTGIVTSIESEQSTEGTTYYPVFLFTDHDGREHAVRSSFGSNPPMYTVQDRIQILYDPASPEKAKVSSFWSLYAAGTILGIGGLMNFAMSLVFLFVVPVVRKLFQCQS